MLADQWLRHRERVDEFMHAARRLTQLQHDRDSHRRGQGTQQVARCQLPCARGLTTPSLGPSSAMTLTVIPVCCLNSGNK